MPDAPDSPFDAGLRRKSRALALLLGALVALFVLAIGITDLPLLPGQWFAINLLPFARPEGGSIGGGEAIVLFVRILLAVALLLLPINLIAVIFMREARRRLLIHIATAIALWALLNMIVQAARDLPENLLEQAGQRGERTDGMPPLTPLPDFTPNPSEWAVLAAALAISLLIVGLAGIAGWAIWRRRMRADDSLARLGRRAQAALDELESGADLGSVVIRCYRDMTRVLQQERGIAREVAMTPSEFEQMLRGKGLPQAAVQQLTRVFEDVRYGGQPAGEREERLAKESLAAIVAACAQPRGTP
ncbi:MAG: DUF4129 domain-containing protein [Thermoflexales bacterium]|nr:DUF4129 domain-containing protein [Thermoflexales bacterium]MDW8352740.1 DUF4129 domain-containing protein [Anaerolineae bacterium]